MGSSNNGRLGHDENMGFVKFPADPATGGSGIAVQVRSISAGSDFTVAVGMDGESIYGWGLGIYGE